MLSYTLHTLINDCNHGKVPEFIPFYGHTNKRNDDRIGKECLSNFYPATITDFYTDIQFPSVEHYMHYHKARRYGDFAKMAEILNTDNPYKAKALGRQVANFDEKDWAYFAPSVVYLGCVMKFSQHEALLQYMVSTMGAVFVEASPNDVIWGVGLAEDNPDIQNPLLWRGHNLLGFILNNIKVNFLEQAQLQYQKEIIKNLQGLLGT